MHINPGPVNNSRPINKIINIIFKDQERHETASNYGHTYRSGRINLYLN